MRTEGYAEQAGGGMTQVVDNGDIRNALIYVAGEPPTQLACLKFDCKLKQTQAVLARVPCGHIQAEFAQHTDRTIEFGPDDDEETLTDSDSIRRTRIFNRSQRSICR